MRRIAIGIAAVVLLLGTCHYLPPLERHPVGGRWSTHYTSSLSMDAHGTNALYRAGLLGVPVRVATDVHVDRYYAPDCLLYEQREMTTVLADCGSGAFVVAEHGYDDQRRFEATAAGLHRAIDLRVEDGVATWTVERIPIERIRAAARAPRRAARGVAPIVTHEPIDVRTRDPRGAWPLLRAIRGGQRDVAIALLRAGADVNAADGIGMTPLQVASAFPPIDTILLRAILDAKPDLERPDAAGQTPLLRAALLGDTVVVRMLLEKGADPCGRDGKARTLADIGASKAPAVHAVLARAYARCGGREPLGT